MAFWSGDVVLNGILVRWCCILCHFGQIMFKQMTLLSNNVAFEWIFLSNYTALNFFGQMMFNQMTFRSNDVS